MSEVGVAPDHGRAPGFELHVTLPAAAPFAETARELAVHAARHAGCSDARARAFGDEVATAFRREFERAGSGASVPMVLRRAAGPVEVLVDGRTLTLDL